MFIQRIDIKDFRVYKGFNRLDFSPSEGRNVSIISGNNGFGKTSLLTSLVWCLYGKLMGDVDERYKREILQSGGYKKYCQKIFNRSSIEENLLKKDELELVQLTGTDSEKKTAAETIQSLFTFSVGLHFRKIFIPAIPCDSLEIIRSYNVLNDEEQLSILIDAQANELTKQVGPEIFINDFVLRKEIAKFFFFDAEKIVELAEITTVEEKQKLGQAYGEVLGIKKYLDLKEDLENVRLRLKKKHSSVSQKEKLEILEKNYEQNGKLITHNQTVLQEREQELAVKRAASDQLQEQLIREGSSLTLKEMKEFKVLRSDLQAKIDQLKAQMKGFVDLAPLAIAAKQLRQVRQQFETERDQKESKAHEALLRRKAGSLKAAITKSGHVPNAKKRLEIFDILDQYLIPNPGDIRTPLLDYSVEQENQFSALHEHLQHSFAKRFKEVVSELKQYQSSLGIVVRKLADAESKEDDAVIKAIRNSKNTLEDEINALEKACIDVKANILSLDNSQRNLSQQISELKKNLRVEAEDKARDEVAERLIKGLEQFIYKLKVKKKGSLEQKILKELQLLMHKGSFVFDVKVLIDGDLIDIELLDQGNKIIDKKTLSKGEQQLYATALLKALVEESQIRFPVFIDSPLQKFDKDHARSIISEFYPKVSEQVILFPLLEKELNEGEYSLLFPKVADCYLIEHLGLYNSRFIQIDPKKLFIPIQELTEDVYRN